MSGWNKAAFKRYVYEQAERLDVSFKSVAVRRMEKKWASCSVNGNLTFNSELLALDRAVAEYAVLHELMHLRVPNHGKLWKVYMAAFSDNYQDLDKRIRLVASCRLGE